MISEVCTLDVRTGAAAVRLRHEGFRLEAPNWERAGTLLLNGDGRLWRLGEGLEEVPTGGLAALNNDHGPSPDGSLIAFSAKSEAGASCVYAMPAAGGAARRVTPLVPSWFHAWSPDGGRLLYAAARDGGPVHVRSCAADGSDERVVADGFDHADGPDATPEGAWVWFNGERDGSCDLWRVRWDGTGMERMTEGEGVDWFPHPSPCGRHVLFLRYPAGTEGHPADLDVALMLMPAEGGEAVELLRLRGGQGTINVPCWSPDASAFAFARYPA